MPAYVIKQTRGYFCANQTWGADSPMIFLHRGVAEETLQKYQLTGYGLSAALMEYDDDFEAWQLNTFLEACRAIRDYGCDITQDGMALRMHPINNSPQIEYRLLQNHPALGVCTIQRRGSGDESDDDWQTVEHRELMHQFEQNSPVARWLSILWGMTGIWTATHHCDPDRDGGYVEHTFEMPLFNEKTPCQLQS